MCIKAVGEVQWSLKYVSNNLNTQGMCKKAVEKGPSMLKYVPDHFKAGLSWRQEKERQKKIFFWPFDMLRLKMY